MRILPLWGAFTFLARVVHGCDAAPYLGRGLKNHFSMHLAAHEILVRVPIRVRGEQKRKVLVRSP